MSTDLQDPNHPANTQPGLHESELNPLDRDNPGPMGTVAGFLGFGMSLWAAGEVTSAIGGGLETGSIEVIGAMPEGGVTAAAEMEYAAMNPAPAVAPQTAPAVADPFAIPTTPGVPV